MSAAVVTARCVSVSDVELDRLLVADEWVDGSYKRAAQSQISIAAVLLFARLAWLLCG